jgi:uncharacterized protein YjbI with pentapeptide repeats
MGAIWERLLDADRLRTHGRWFRNGAIGAGRMVLEEADLSGARLTGVQFSRAGFTDCTFNNAEITYGEWIETEMVRCNATDSIFIYDKFRRATFVGSQFLRCDLRRSSFTEARLENCRFLEVAFAECHMLGAIAVHTSFRGSGMLDTQLDKAHFSDCDFQEVNLREGQAIETHFENCDFRNANFEHRRFRETTFTRCKFAGATGLPVIEGPVHVIDPDFSEAGDGSDIRTSEVLLSRWSKQA